MKVLLTRFGGIGDIFPTMAVARYMKNRGDDVTVALRDDAEGGKQTDLYSNQDITLLDFRQVGPWGNRCIKTPDGWVTIQSTYKDYDLVVDYTNVIESNSSSPANSSDPTKFWQRSRSSNWVNWYDIHFAWANIDPTTVPDSAKRPFISLTEEEEKLSNEFKSQYSHVFVVSPFASSLARSWYQARDLLPMIEQNKAYKNVALICWEPGAKMWVLRTNKGSTPAKEFSPNSLRNSMIYLKAADAVICVDTGISHIAEGLGAKCLTLYSTVPWWTRAKYYENQVHIDLGEHNPDYYTFSLGLGDPLRILEGRSLLTDRELLIEKLRSRNASFEEASKELNTDLHGAKMELQAYMAKQESWERQQAVALTLINPLSVFEKIKEMVK